MSDSSSTVGSTTDAQVVNTTSSANVVNAAQTQNTATTSSFSVSNAQIDQLQARINNLMSEKDKALHERNQTISQLNDLQARFTSLQTEHSTNLKVAVDTAQAAIDRSHGLEQQLTQSTARSNKFAALLQRPHLAAYESLIPETGDEAKLLETLTKLEEIRNKDIEQNKAPLSLAPPSSSSQQSQQQQAQTPQSVLQALYGNRANMNPMFQNTATNALPLSTPGSSPAQMSPLASPADVTAQIQAIYNDAKRVGTQSAFEEATQKAALLANALGAQFR